MTNLIRKVTRIKPELAKALASAAERMEISEARVINEALKSYLPKPKP